MLFHGFTACPQQWFDLAPLLTEQGYDVLTPVLPGHGLNYQTSGGNITDDFKHLPMNASGYGDFARAMNRIAALAGGEKVVGGLSMGATVAIDASRAVLADGRTGLYSRALIMSPIINVGSAILDHVLNHVFTLPGFATVVNSWGAGCDIERAAGRAGICSMYIGGIAASRNFGKDLLAEQFTTPPNTAVQVVYDLGDPVVSTDSVEKYYNQEASTANQHSMCTMSHDVGHSMLSKYDNPKEFKWWREELHCRLASFLTQTTMDPSASPPDLNQTSTAKFLSSGSTECGFQCTSETCAYSPSKPVTCPYRVM